MPKHITRQLKEEIVNYYVSRPMTICDVSAHFDISGPSIIKILDEYRIKRYSRVQLFSPDLDEYYFEQIDTEAKAYFLGLIITDGCIYSSKGRQPLVSLTIQEQDDYILKEFKNQINSNKKITNDGRGCSEINILSSNIVNSLRKYGLCERKSLVSVFPNNIPLDLYPHLIRGIFDGDGSASYYARPNRNSHTKAIRFCQGNPSFLEDLVDFLYEERGIQRVNLYREKDSLWSIAYRKNESMINLIDYMYDDANIYLKRKKRICDFIYDEINKYGNTEITA